MISVYSIINSCANPIDLNSSFDSLNQGFSNILMPMTSKYNDIMDMVCHKWNIKADMLSSIKTHLHFVRQRVSMILMTT